MRLSKSYLQATARRKDGIPVKTFELKGIDEQAMVVQVNNTGDISGIKLNGKNAPYTPVKLWLSWVNH
ncbi:Uncharacterised protein [Citrobacter freundii]|nr:Uncharacterised protein [Citrobacter freundii]